MIFTLSAFRVQNRIKISVINNNILCNILGTESSLRTYSTILPILPRGGFWRNYLNCRIAAGALCSFVNKSHRVKHTQQKQKEGEIFLPLFLLRFWSQAHQAQIDSLNKQLLSNYWCLNVQWFSLFSTGVCSKVTPIGAWNCG